MDVWAVLSLIANVAMQLSNEAALLAAGAPARVGVAAACLLGALVLVVFAGLSAKAKRRAAATVEDEFAPPARLPALRAAVGDDDHERPPVAPARRTSLSADDAFATHALTARRYRAFDAAPAAVRQPRVREREREPEPTSPRLSLPRPGLPSPQAPAPVPVRPASTRDIIARLEAKRGSRVVAIIHRENMERSFLDVADLEDALTAIRKTPKDKPLDIILHSPGGHIRVGQQIARAIHAHPAKTTVFVPYFALGSTTFMAFAADEIVMSEYAALSPVDPFAGAGPASSVLKAIENKPIDRIDDETVICADMAHKMLDEARRVTCELMDDKGDEEGVCRLADDLVSGKWSRDRAITAYAAHDLGLNVSLAMPAEVYDLVRSCRRGRANETSVAFLDHARIPRKAIAAPGRSPQAPAFGVFDSSLAHMTEFAKLPTTGVLSSTKAVLFAQEGGHLPEASVDRAKALIRAIEKERGSRVICVIHGENMENEGFNFDDLEDVLSAIVVSDSAKPLDIVLHTQGGNSFTGRQIARAIKAHRAKKTVFVPYYAMSAGSRISLAADQIVMGAHATLGPIDTQLYGWPAPSILRLLEVKPVEAIGDEFLILAAEARKVMAEGRASACELLQGTYSDDGSCAIADEMISGRWTHGFPITANVAKSLGLNVSTNLPDVFYELVRCFRHADGEDPSVLFIPR